jgi:hypothetical protein
MQSQPRSKSEPNLRVVGMSRSSTPSTHRGLALARIGTVSVSIITFMASSCLTLLTYLQKTMDVVIEFLSAVSLRCGSNIDYPNLNCTEVDK